MGKTAERGDRNGMIRKIIHIEVVQINANVPTPVMVDRIMIKIFLLYLSERDPIKGFKIKPIIPNMARDILEYRGEKNFSSCRYEGKKDI